MLRQCLLINSVLKTLQPTWHTLNRDQREIKKSMELAHCAIIWLTIKIIFGSVATHELNYRFWLTLPPNYPDEQILSPYQTLMYPDPCLYCQQNWSYISHRTTDTMASRLCHGNSQEQSTASIPKLFAHSNQFQFDLMDAWLDSLYTHLWSPRIAIITKRIKENQIQVAQNAKEEKRRRELAKSRNAELTREAQRHQNIVEAIEREVNENWLQPWEKYNWEGGLKH